MFTPTEQSLKVEYQELDNIEEFSQLTQGELLFVWYYANSTSPYVAIKDTVLKADKCIEKSYGKKLGLNEIQRFHKGIFPDHIAVAIDRMSRFTLDTRLRAKSMVDSIFDTFESIINDKPDDLITSMDKQQKFIDNSIKIIDALPNIIKRKEEGFGIKTKNSKEKRTATIMDIAMQHEEEA